MTLCSAPPPRPSGFRLRRAFSCLCLSSALDRLPSDYSPADAVAVAAVACAIARFSAAKTEVAVAGVA